MYKLILIFLATLISACGGGSGGSGGSGSGGEETPKDSDLESTYLWDAEYNVSDSFSVVNKPTVNTDSLCAIEEFKVSLGADDNNAKIRNGSLISGDRRFLNWDDMYIGLCTMRISFYGSDETHYGYNYFFHDKSSDTYQKSELLNDSISEVYETPTMSSWRRDHYQSNFFPMSNREQDKAYAVGILNDGKSMLFTIDLDTYDISVKEIELNDGEHTIIDVIENDQLVVYTYDWATYDEFNNRKRLDLLDKNGANIDRLLLEIYSFTGGAVQSYTEEDYIQHQFRMNVLANTADIPKEILLNQYVYDHHYSGNNFNAVKSTCGIFNSDYFTHRRINNDGTFDMLCYFWTDEALKDEFDEGKYNVRINTNWYTIFSLDDRFN